MKNSPEIKGSSIDALAAESESVVNLFDIEKSFADPDQIITALQNILSELRIALEEHSSNYIGLVEIGSIARPVSMKLMHFGFDFRNMVNTVYYGNLTYADQHSLDLMLDLGRLNAKLERLKAGYSMFEKDYLEKLRTVDSSPYYNTPSPDFVPKNPGISDRMYNVRMAIMAALAITAATGTIVSTVWARSILARRECIEATLGSIKSEGNECVDLHNESEGLCIDASRMLLRCYD